MCVATESEDLTAHTPLNERLLMKNRILFTLFCLVSSLTGGLLVADPVTATVEQVLVDQQALKLSNIDPSLSEEEPVTVKVGAGDLWVDYEGKTIRGDLIVSDGVHRLQTIWPHDPKTDQWMSLINRQLRADTATRQRRQYRKEGDYGINFAMFTEEGEAVQFSEFKGKWVILNFIFTRCRVQEMCPAQTARMAELQEEAASRGIENLHQLSVTFDPRYDTPGILQEYARANGIQTDRFDFLTGPHEVMLDVLKQYGVIAFESKNIIDHTVTTLLFDPTGRIVYRRDGTQWSVDDFLNRIDS